MSDELVERLRQLANNTGKMTWVNGLPMPANAALHLAADRIEALTAEVQRLTYDGIHTCHAECPRLPCVQRREIEALTKALIDGAGELEGFVCYFDDMVKVSEMAKWRGWAGQEPKPEWTPYDQAAATIAALRAEVERKDAAIGNAIGAICFTYDDPNSAVVTELYAALAARGLEIREIKK